MAKASKPEQLALDLFAASRPPYKRKDPRESFIELARQRGKGADVIEAANKVFDACEAARGRKAYDAYDRCRILLKDISVSDAVAYGLYDLSLDYHTIWDRAWAHVNGVDRELIPLVFGCNYHNSRPTFYDKDGKPLQTVTAPWAKVDKCKTR